MPISYPDLWGWNIQSLFIDVCAAGTTWIFHENKIKKDFRYFELI